MHVITYIGVKGLLRVLPIPMNAAYYPAIGSLKSAEYRIYFDKEDHKFDIATLPEYLIPLFVSTNIIHGYLMIVIREKGKQQILHGKL